MNLYRHSWCAVRCGGMPSLPSVVSRKYAYICDIVKPSPLMGEGWVGVTPAQMSWLAACELCGLLRGDKPGTKMKHVLTCAKRQASCVQLPLVYRLYWGTVTPTLPSPIEGEGSSWQRGSDLPKRIVIGIERHDTSAPPAVWRLVFSGVVAFLLCHHVRPGEEREEHCRARAVIRAGGRP